MGEIFIIHVDVYLHGEFLATESYTHYYGSLDSAEKVLIKDGYEYADNEGYEKQSGNFEYRAEIITLDKGEDI